MTQKPVPDSLPRPCVDVEALEELMRTPVAASTGARDGRT